MNKTEVKCAWCGVELWPADSDVSLPAVSHGICLNCVVREFGVPIENMESVALEKLNASPFGVIVLDFQGKILQYNQYEAELSSRPRESVLGRNFFTEVAPCTAVREFKGKFDGLVKDGSGAARFSFIFAFPGRKTYVNIRLELTEGRNKVIALVKKVSEQAV